MEKNFTFLLQHGRGYLWARGIMDDYILTSVVHFLKAFCNWFRIIDY